MREYWFVTPGLTHYSKVWNKFCKLLNAVNCGIGGDREQIVLWRVHDLHPFLSLKNVVVLWGTNNLYKDSPEDISNGLTKIAGCLRQGNNSILLCNDISWINRFLIKETTNILKSSCSVNHINFIDQDINWIQVSSPLKVDLFYSNNCTWWKKEILF